MNNLIRPQRIGCPRFCMTLMAQPIRKSLRTVACFPIVYGLLCKFPVLQASSSMFPTICTWISCVKEGKEVELTLVQARAYPCWNQSPPSISWCLRTLSRRCLFYRHLVPLPKTKDTGENVAVPCWLQWFSGVLHHILHAIGQKLAVNQAFGFLHAHQTVRKISKFEILQLRVQFSMLKIVLLKNRLGPNIINTKHKKHPRFNSFIVSHAWSDKFREATIAEIPIMFSSHLISFGSIIADCQNCLPFLIRECICSESWTATSVRIRFLVAPAFKI